MFVSSGIARGSGWQHTGAHVNLGAFYLCGIPVAVILSFLAKLRGRGLWIAIQTGSFVQTVVLSIITSRTDWEKKVYPPLLSLDAFVLSLAQNSFLLCFIAKTLEGGKDPKYWNFSVSIDPECSLNSHIWLFVHFLLYIWIFLYPLGNWLKNLPK